MSATGHPAWCVTDRDDEEWMTHVSEPRVEHVVGLDIRGWLEQEHGDHPPTVQVRADGGHLGGSANDLQDLTIGTAKVVGQILIRLHDTAIAAVMST